MPGRPQLPDILQFANASTLSLPDCRRRFKKLPVVNYIHDSIVCTTNPANQGACMGDSGTFAKLIISFYSHFYFIKFHFVFVFISKVAH